MARLGRCWATCGQRAHAGARYGSDAAGPSESSSAADVGVPCEHPNDAVGPYELLAGVDAGAPCAGAGALAVAP